MTSASRRRGPAGGVRRRRGARPRGRRAPAARTPGVTVRRRRRTATTWSPTSTWPARADRRRAARGLPRRRHPRRGGREHRRDQRAALGRRPAGRHPQLPLRARPVVGLHRPAGRAPSSSWASCTTRRSARRSARSPAAAACSTAPGPRLVLRASRRGAGRAELRPVGRDEARMAHRRRRAAAGRRRHPADPGGAAPRLPRERPAGLRAARRGQAVGRRGGPRARPGGGPSCSAGPAARRRPSSSSPRRPGCGRSSRADPRRAAADGALSPGPEPGRALSWPDGRAPDDLRRRPRRRRRRLDGVARLRAPGPGQLRDRPRDLRGRRADRLPVGADHRVARPADRRRGAHDLRHHQPVLQRDHQGASEAARVAGYALLLADTSESGHIEREAVERTLDLVEGVLLTSSRMSDSAIRMIAKQKPVVLLNRQMPDISCITIDNPRGVRRAAEHLGMLGHRTITYVAGPAASWTDGVRWRALREAAHELELRVHRIDPEDAPTMATGYRAAQRLADEGATAVLAFNDALAVGVMKGLTAPRPRRPRRRQRRRVRQHPARGGRRTAAHDRHRADAQGGRRGGGQRDGAGPRRDRRRDDPRPAGRARGPGVHGPP